MTIGPFDGIPACPVFEKASLEVHMLTSSFDAELATWALLSWYRLGERTDKLSIHDDGSLSNQDKARFRSFFPHCQIILRDEADEKAALNLRDYPAVASFRQKNVFALKLLDFCFYANTPKIVLLDSDALTFGRINTLEGCETWAWNAFLRDYQIAFSLNRDDFERYGASHVYVPANSGFGVIHASTLRLDLLDRVLCENDFTAKPFWAEQTVYALLSAPFGIHLFDDSHIVARRPGLSGIRLKHYVWKMRELAKAEAIPRIREQLLQPQDLSRTLQFRDAASEDSHLHGWSKS